MKHKFQFSYKRQKLLTFTLVGSSLLVCLMSQAREFPSIKLPQKEYRLTGTSLQSVKEIVPYYDSCNTVYDDSLYQGEIVVTQEGTAGHTLCPRRSSIPASSRPRLPARYMSEQRSDRTF